MMNLHELNDNDNDNEIYSKPGLQEYETYIIKQNFIGCAISNT